MRLFLYTAPEGLLFAVASGIQRSTLVGSDRLTLYSGGRPYAVDFDYRFYSKLAICVICPQYFHLIIISPYIETTIFFGMTHIMIEFGGQMWMGQIQWS